MEIDDSPSSHFVVSCLRALKISSSNEFYAIDHNGSGYIISGFNIECSNQREGVLDENN
jgi:hypothetical protein